MKNFKEYVSESKKTYYAIKNIKTKSVLSTHDNENDANDEWEGLGSDKNNYKVVKTTKAPKEGDSLSEAVAFINRKWDKNVEKMLDMNKDRVGQTIITPEGKEVPDSVVLSKYTHAYMSGKNSLTIKTANFINEETVEISLSKDELNNLRKL